MYIYIYIYVGTYYIPYMFGTGDITVNKSKTHLAPGLMELTVY